MIHERDHTNAIGESDALAAKQSNEVRLKFRDIKEDIKVLEKMQRKKEKKFKKIAEPDEETIEKNSQDKEIIELANKHMLELEKMERFGDDFEAAGLFQDEQSEPELVGGIPDLDDPQFNALRQADVELEEDLQDILDALKNVKQIAEAMNQELKAQEELINKVDENMDQVEQRLSTVNGSLKNVLKKVRGPKQFFCDVLLCLLILGVAAAYVKLLIKKN